ncbi:MAG: hypothetical protein KJO50_00640 [Bacteroidia bacterium]|nr:hypothetical protein [Bacteroidia bacterium]
MKKISIYASFFLYTIMISCARDAAEPVDTNCSGITTYDEQAQEVIDTNCSYSGCHDGTGAAPGNYSFYNGLKVTFNNSDEFINRVIVLKDMPPSDATGPVSLSEEDFNILLCWIESGFPEK